MKGPDVAVPVPTKLNQYRVADARQIGDSLPPKASVSLTVTSPPYWNLKDYEVRQQIGFGQAYDAYLSDLVQVFKQVLARTTDDGSLWIVSDTLKIDGEVRLLPFDLAARLSQCGWILQDILIWHKDRTLPWSHQGKLRNIFEYITFFTKTRHFKYNVNAVRDITDIKDYWVKYPERYSLEGKTPSRSWNFPIPRQGSWGTAKNFVQHTCPLPVGLVERIIALTSSPKDVVLDPFAGSGTVLAVADAMGRRYFGTDLSRKHQQLYYKTVLPSVRKRITASTTETDRSRLDRRRFSQFVGKLRRLKYAKEALRLYRRNHTSRLGNCNAIWVLPGKSSDSLRLVFAFRGRVPTKFATEAQSLCKRPPLSKYGLIPDVMAIADSEYTLSQLRRHLGASSRRVYAYRDGRFYFWHQSTSAKGAIDLMLAADAQGTAKSYPVILSPIGIRLSTRDPMKALRTKANGEVKVSH